MSKPTPLVVLSLSAMVLMLGVGMIVAVLPGRVHAMTGTLESVGLVASVFALAYLAAQLPISALSDRLGPKRFLVIGYCLTAGAISDRVGRHGFLVWGMALAAAGFASFPVAAGLWAYLPLGIAGIGLGIFCVASIAELNESVPGPLKGAISGSYYFFWGAGYVLGPLAIGAVGDNASMGFAALAVLLGLHAVAVRIAGT